MKKLIFALICISFSSGHIFAADKNYSDISFDQLINSLPGEFISTEHLKGSDSYPAYKAKKVPPEFFKKDSSPIQQYKEWCVAQNGVVKQQVWAPAYICFIGGKPAYGMSFQNFHDKSQSWILDFYGEEEVALVKKNQDAMNRRIAERMQADAELRKAYVATAENDRIQIEQKARAEKLKILAGLGVGDLICESLKTSAGRVIVKAFIEQSTDRKFKLTINSFNFIDSPYLTYQSVSGTDGAVYSIGSVIWSEKTTNWQPCN